MNHILLYEKYIAPFDASLKKAKDRWEKLDALTGTSDDFIEEAVNAMYKWFYGGFMSGPHKYDNDYVKKITDVFNNIGKIYHTPVDKKMYRIAHLQIESGMGTKEIRNINKAQSGPKQLQSWSTSIDGAEWFFDHFVRSQNKDDKPHPTKTWVLLSTDAENLNQLLTFEECMQFLYDIGHVDSDVEELADRLVSDNMLKLHELICDTPKEVPVKIENILVPPIKRRKRKNVDSN